MLLSTLYTQLRDRRITTSLLSMLLLTLILLPSALRAQLDQRTTGQTYVLAFPDTTTNTFDARYPNKMEGKIYIYIYSSTSNNKITVTGNGYNRVFTGQPGKFTIIDLTDPTFKAPLPIVTVPNTASKNTFRIETETPVVVYCYMVTRFGSEAWTPIPVEFWGKEYYAAGRQGEIGKDISPGGEFQYNAQKKQFPAEIIVIASEDNTIVTITPNGRLTGPTQQPTFTLMKNEAYLVHGFVDTARVGESQPDLAGSYITSTKPIGVISGNTRSQVVDEIAGLGKNIFKNMMIEWITPVEQHGREFVYMPTMDNRRPTGQPNEKIEEKRSAEFVRIYATNPNMKKTTGSHTDPITGNSTFFKISAPRQFFDHRNSIPEAVYYKTDSIAQAFMNSSAVVKFLGTTGWGTYVGAKYDGWGTYMVEMTPREQWVNAAPFFAPAHPANMEHFVNIVTDSASAKKIFLVDGTGTSGVPVLINRQIKGTNLVWGYFIPPADQDLFITGWNVTTRKQDTAVRFYAFAYGLYKGHEEYRPGKSGRKDDNNGGSIASANGGGSDEVLHPSEYEEYQAVAYGYPLAPSRITLRSGDVLQIDTVMECTTLDVNIRMLNTNPVGIRSIQLDSNSNAKIIFVDPTSPVNATTKVHFKVLPINAMKNANATVVIRDRANKVWRFPYTYDVENITAIPGDFLDFGDVIPATPSPVKEIVVTNPLNRDIDIRNLAWVDGTQSFEIVSPQIPPTITLKPGESVRVQVRITPMIEHTVYRDTLRIITGCIETRLPVMAVTGVPAGIGTETYDASSASLSRAEPNPTDGITTFSFTLARPAFTTLELYNALGEHVATIVDGDRSAGEHRVDWNLGELSAGMYYYRLRSGTFSATRSLVVR